MSQMIDNVFSTEVTKETVSIKVGFCDTEILKKGEISENDVKNIKEICLNSSDYRMFINAIIAAGIELQQKHGVDLGFKI